MTLNNAKALITGGSRGIGRAIAVAYAKAGAQLVVTARNQASLAETVEEVTKAGGTAHAMEWDVSDIASIGPKLEQARSLLGGIDILVNNAGVLRLPAESPDQSAEALWDYVMTINLKSVYFICQKAGEMMKERNRGVIINLASDAGMRAAPSPYGISKWGVIGLTKGFAKQLRGEGVRVNAIAPGPVATSMMKWEPGKSMDAPQLPLGRFSLPEEVADVAVFLASEESRAIIGQTVVVNSANT
jgi:NAD(P)-dependent dehydrogenase (short-subunit alcohol dehydrogenase family)